MPVLSLAHVLGGLLVGAVVTVRTLQFLSRKRSALPFPPGPRSLPFVGNLFDLSPSLQWLQYTRWAKQYGDLFSVTVPGKVIVVLNSHAAVEDVVSKTRPSVLSSRPFNKFFQITQVDEINVTVMPYNSRWRERRRIIEKNFRPASIQNYQPVQRERVIIAAQRLARDPRHFSEHIREYAGAVILAIVYGYDVKDMSDALVRDAEEYNSLFARVLLPGELIVNTFPFLGQLPRWVLGPSFAQLADRVRHLSASANSVPFYWTKKEVENGTARPSLVRSSLADWKEDDGETELAYREAFGHVYAAASDTTVTALMTFMFAMLIQPDVQARARAELDNIVGRERLPTFNDRPQLPYINALVIEVIRWNPVAPIGIPHVANEDVICRDYYIPQGSMVIMNAWAILRNPDLYHEPDKFQPQRFLSASGKVVDDSMLEYAFGFGGRRCPGRHFADTTMWIFIATVLAEFKIERVENAKEIKIEEAYPGYGFFNPPLPFECRISPRDSQALELLQSQ